MAAHEVPAGPSRTRASAAGVYDWCLGGRHHLDCDAEAGIEALRRLPTATLTARYNREFLRRVVRWMVEQGIRQFLDLGSGYPTVGNVHEIAQDHARDARVVYVDLDPDTVAVSTRLLADNPQAVCIQGDVCDPDAVLRHEEVRRLLDFSQPAGLLMISVLPFVPGDAGPVVRHYKSALAPGSYLAISHVTPPEDDRAREQQAALAASYNKTVETPARLRTREEILALFARTELVPPGLGRATDWHPAPGHRTERDDQAAAVLLGGVARIP
ncbi:MULTISPECIES: SAM-dependent methyltransferase [Amycolatopsis]|uniref:SAM-dependent methyltransferase n=1 Tax=Amycolatopsis dongchuanensis TaxID=1070866 RepID=A0ABP9PV75_9PSEU